jgi:DNA modification methylase
MSRIETIAEGITLHPGDCLDVLAAMADASVDSCVCDPPYHLTSIVKRFGAPDAAPAKEGKTGAYARASRGFMGKQWDGGDIAFRTDVWAHVLRVLKPGGHLLAFSGTRTYHRMTCAIEDAGFEIRDQIGWAYGSGFPKSHDVSKGIDRAAGAEREIVGVAGRSGSRRACMAGDFKGGEYFATEASTDEAAQWQGWGTALKPAWEPIVLARKPLIGTVAQNVLAHGTGAINIDGCRVEAEKSTGWSGNGRKDGLTVDILSGSHSSGEARPVEGRWPANIVHDGSEEVVAAFPETTSGTFSGHRNEPKTNGVYGKFELQDEKGHVGDSGSAARFFKACPITDKDMEWTRDRASFAESSLSLSSEVVASALSRAVAASTLRLELQLQSYRAPSMTVTASEFAEIETLVTATIQNLERRSWRGLPLEKLTLTGNHASIAATPKPTGITTITINLLRLNGYAEPVTFNTIETNAEAGALPGKRLFYTAKADADDRLGSKHPTVKPLDLMQWLVRLVTPPGGTVLDPFAGTGTTGEAAFREGFRAVLIEREPEYQNDIRRRMSLVLGGPDERKRESIKASGKAEGAGPLFEGIA